MRSTRTRTFATSKVSFLSVSGAKAIGFPTAVANLLRLCLLKNRYGIPQNSAVTEAEVIGEYPARILATMVPQTLENLQCSKLVGLGEELEFEDLVLV